MKVQRQLIINADDFGLSESINLGIFQAWQKGLVTSVSIMACGRAFNHAVALARQNKFDNIGLHLVLDEEAPVLSSSEIPSLVTDKGILHPRKTLLMRLLFSSKINLNEVEKEFRAQIERCKKAGLALTHIDGHGHVHVYPKISKIIVRLAKEYGIKKVRIPYKSEPLKGYDDYYALQPAFEKTFRKRLKKILSCMQISNGKKRLLDIGCGPSFF